MYFFNWWNLFLKEVNSWSHKGSYGWKTMAVGCLHNCCCSTDSPHHCLLLYEQGDHLSTRFICCGPCFLTSLQSLLLSYYVFCLLFQCFFLYNFYFYSCICLIFSLPGLSLIIEISGDWISFTVVEFSYWFSFDSFFFFSPW